MGNIIGTISGGIEHSRFWPIGQGPERLAFKTGASTVGKEVFLSSSGNSHWKLRGVPLRQVADATAACAPAFKPSQARLYGRPRDAALFWARFSRLRGTCQFPSSPGWLPMSVTLSPFPARPSKSLFQRYSKNSGKEKKAKIHTKKHEGGGPKQSFGPRQERFFLCSVLG